MHLTVYTQRDLEICYGDLLPDGKSMSPHAPDVAGEENPDPESPSSKIDSGGDEFSEACTSSLFGTIESFFS